MKQVHDRFYYHDKDAGRYSIKSNYTFGSYFINTVWSRWRVQISEVAFGTPFLNATRIGKIVTLFFFHLGVDNVEQINQNINTMCLHDFNTPAKWGTFYWQSGVIDFC